MEVNVCLSSTKKCSVQSVWFGGINQLTLNMARTSSSKDGKIFRVRRPSEKRSRTLVSPRMNEIFSSRVFAVKFERSRKFRVEIGSEEKNE
jgi:hypothetical protein